MKNIITILAVILISLICAESSYGQHGQQFQLRYNFGTLGGSKMRQVVDQDSWAGWQAEYTWSLSPRVALGLSMNYQRFEEKRDRATFIIDNTSINAVTLRTFTSLPVMAIGKYYFLTEGIRPFLDLGLGGAWNNQYVDFSDYELAEESFNFNFMAGGGVLFPVGRGTSLLLAFKYNHSGFDPVLIDANQAGYWVIGTGVALDF